MLLTPPIKLQCRTDELLVATCATRPFAERYAKSQDHFFQDYK
jgi:hypothetical protein